MRQAFLKNYSWSSLNFASAQHVSERHHECTRAASMRHSGKQGPIQHHVGQACDQLKR
jgi:hypothetical protein